MYFDPYILFSYQKWDSFNFLHLYYLFLFVWAKHLCVYHLLTVTLSLGPGSLPGYARRRLGGPGGEYDDGASDISSTSGFSAYGYRSGMPFIIPQKFHPFTLNNDEISGTRLYREPASKSNRSIILNAIEYVVFPGVVNAETRNRVLDVIDRCDCPHFLLLFRDVKCQFRGLYAYYPDTEEVYKIYGVGPKQVADNMFETFFK